MINRYFTHRWAIQLALWSLNIVQFCINLFCRSADEVVKRLAPYFKVDYLLPRTLLASLRLDLMHSIVRVNDISPDIILAASCYYLKKKPNNVSMHYSFSSPDLECQMSYCHHFVSIAVIAVVSKFFTFQSLLRKKYGPLEPSLEWMFIR